MAYQAPIGATPLEDYIRSLEPGEAQGLRDHNANLQYLIDRGRVAASQPFIPRHLPPLDHPGDPHGVNLGGSVHSSYDRDAALKPAHAEGAVYTRLLLLSSAVPEAEVLLDAVTDDTAVVFFDVHSFTLQQLFQVAEETLNGTRVASVGLLTDGAPGSLGLLAPYDRITLQSLATATGVQRFVLDLATLVRPRGRIDLLSPLVALSEEGQQLVGDLHRLTGRHVTASARNTYASDFSLEYPTPGDRQHYLDPSLIARWRGLLPPALLHGGSAPAAAPAPRPKQAAPPARAAVGKALPMKGVVSAVITGGLMCLGLGIWAEYTKTDAEKKFEYCMDRRSQDTTDATVFAWTAAAVEVVAVLLGNGAAGCCICCGCCRRRCTRREVGAVLCMLLSWAGLVGSLTLFAAGTVVELDEINRGPGLHCADLNLLKDWVFAGAGIAGLAACLFSVGFFALVVKRRAGNTGVQAFGQGGALEAPTPQAMEAGGAHAGAGAGGVPSGGKAPLMSHTTWVTAWMTFFFAFVPAATEIAFGAAKWSVSCSEDLQLYNIVHGGCVIAFCPLFLAAVALRDRKARAEGAAGHRVAEGRAGGAATVLAAAAAMVLTTALAGASVYAWSLDEEKRECNETLLYMTRGVMLCWYLMLLVCGVWGVYMTARLHPSRRWGK